MTTKEDLAKFSDAQVEYIYRALKASIESRSGMGFHNGDMRHPAYTVGAQGKPADVDGLGDGPEQNQLYQLIKAASDSLEERGQQGNFAGYYRFSDWESFCKFAVGEGK